MIPALHRQLCVEGGGSHPFHDSRPTLNSSGFSFVPETELTRNRDPHFHYNHAMHGCNVETARVSTCAFFTRIYSKHILGAIVTPPDAF